MTTMENPRGDLVEELRRQIASAGPMPFRRFMETALYDPRLGYYASGRAAIGRRGDFFTSVSAGPLLGRLLAAQIHEAWERLGTGEMTVVEQGAAHGDLAADILAAVDNDWPDLRATIRYVIVEPLEILRDRQRQKLAGEGRVEWVPNLSGLPRFTGIHVSNELLDALPVHLVRRARGQWHELFVTIDGDRFEWHLEPPSDPELRLLLQRLPHDLPDGYQTEINVEATRWVRELARHLERGFILTIDYGYPFVRYYEPSRREGTLSCYSAHQRSFNPLESPGQMDITAHVDFTTLAETARSAGLHLAGFTDQHHFAVALAEMLSGKSPFTPAERRNFVTLMHPDFLGARFKVIAFSTRDGDCLSGFKHTPGPEKALGL